MRLCEFKQAVEELRDRLGLGALVQKIDKVFCKHLNDHWVPKEKEKADKEKAGACACACVRVCVCLSGRSLPFDCLLDFRMLAHSCNSSSTKMHV